MAKSIYLICPRSDAATLYGAEVYEARGLSPTRTVADLALPTVAALVPEGFRVELCDEHLDPVNLGTDADFVGITGYINQR